MITSLYLFPTPTDQLAFSPCNNNGLDMDLRIGSARPLVTDANQDYKGLIFFAYLLKRNKNILQKEKENEKRNDIIYLLEINPRLQFHSCGFICLFIDDLFSNFLGQGI
jgi:hypothetical protein